MQWCKNISIREIYSNKILPQETRKITNKQPKLTLKATRERIKNQTQISRCIDIIKIKAQISEREMEKYI